MCVMCIGSSGIVGGERDKKLMAWKFMQVRERCINEEGVKEGVCKMYVKNVDMWYV